MDFKRKYFLFFLVLFFITIPVFSKAKKNLLTVPTNVQEKISSTRETPKSWYICELTNKTKAGNVVIGPLDSKEHAILVWIANSCQPDKDYCISKNKTYITKNPEKFYVEEYPKVKKDIELYGLSDTYEKYFFTNFLNQPTKVESYQTQQKVAEETPQTSVPAETKAPIDFDDGTIDSGLLVTQETPAVEEPAPVIEEPALEPEPAQEETIAEPEPIPEPEPEAEPEPEPEPIPEVFALEEEFQFEEPPVEEPAIEPIPEEEPVAVETVPIFEFPSITSEVNVSRYQKENLLDYAPQKSIPLPQDENLSNTTIIENPDEADVSGCTLLMKAAKSGNNWELNNLLQSGANVNLQDKDGWTALMYAVRYQENTSIVESLISAGANIKITNNYKLSALTMAASYNGNPEILKKLLNYYSASEKDVMQAFVLLLSDNSSSEYSKIAKINAFIEKSISLNTFYNGKTPLMYAAQYSKSTAVIKKLLDYGASTTFRSTDGKSAFDYATENTALPHDDIYWALNKK